MCDALASAWLSPLLSRSLPASDYEFETAKASEPFDFLIRRAGWSPRSHLALSLQTRYQLCEIRGVLRSQTRLKVTSRYLIGYEMEIALHWRS